MRRARFTHWKSSSQGCSLVHWQGMEGKSMSGRGTRYLLACVSMCVCVYVCEHVRVCMCVSVCMCVYMLMYGVRMYVCICAKCVQ